MKATFRIVGLTLALVAALYTPSSAASSPPSSSTWVTCYYFCWPGGRTATGTTYGTCCEGAPGGHFPCPDGSQGSPYGYDQGLGPQFC